MTDHEDLIRRLRAYAQERYLGSRCPNLVHEAADAIKELVAERDKLVWAVGEHVAKRKEYYDRAMSAEAERDRLLLEADPDLPTIAYMTGAHDWKVRAEKAESEAGSARRQYESVRASEKKWADRWYKETQIREKIEDDLAAARKALEKLSCLGNGDLPGNSVGNEIAQRALAAIAAARAEGGE